MRAPWLLTLLLAAACASGPRPLYPGPERPREEVALLEHSYNTTVYAVDGERVRGPGWYLLPGEHVIWVRVRVYGAATNVTYKAWSYCVLTLAADPGVRYEAMMIKREEEAGPLDKKVTLDITIVDSSGRVQAMPDDRQPQRPFL